MVKFTSEKISPAITRIRDGSDVCVYFIQGKERAALIDTGYGIGDLKGYIETITEKPYDIFLTHGHVDHAAGAAQFEKVYMNHKDLDLFKEHCSVEFRKETLREHLEQQLEEEDFIKQRTEPFEDLKDNMVVDLGGITVRWIYVPGHTQGMMIPLIEEERTIIFGDACGVGVLLILPESSTVEGYLKTLKKIQQLESKYDIVLRQHGTCQSTPHVLEDNIENCERIMNGTDDAIPAECFGKKCFRAVAIHTATGARIDGREGNILYLPERIY